MSLNFYLLNFVGSSLVAYVIVKYGFVREPNVGILIGAAIGTLICMKYLGVK